MFKGLAIGLSASVLIAFYGFYAWLSSSGMDGAHAFLDVAKWRWEQSGSAIPVLILGAVIGLVEGISSRLSGLRGLGIWSFRLGKFSPALAMIAMTSWLCLPLEIPMMALWITAGVVGFSVVMLSLRGIPAW